MQKVFLVTGLFFLVSLLISASTFFYVFTHEVIEQSWKEINLPKGVEQEAITPSPFPSPSSSPTPAITPTPTVHLPSEVNLDVPFTPQAPHANWDLPYKDFCEEASVLMAVSYLRGQSIPGPDYAKDKMLEIMEYEEETFGYYKDTTAAETAKILTDYYGIKKVELMETPEIKDIKRALSDNKPVIVPAAGRMLGNPYYVPPGPLYHMIVIKGYTDAGQFIVNDPGTKRGADFLYDQETIMSAMHDWREDGNITKGRQVVIVVG